MNMTKRIYVAVVLATLAACGGEGGAAITASERPSFEGGVGFGSGHRSDTTTTPATTTTNAASQEGGVGFGSGH